MLLFKDRERGYRKQWIAVSLILAAAPLAPPLLAHAHPLAALLIRDFFSRLCHQEPARSFRLYGSPLGVCARCLGIYWGVVPGLLLGLRETGKWRWLLASLFLNLVDVGSGVLQWHGNLPLLRFFFGLLLGLGVGGLLGRREEIEGKQGGMAAAPDSTQLL